MVVTFAQMMPPFALIAYVSSLEKALVACTVIWAIWVAVSERKDSWQKPSFWWLVAAVGAANAIAIWAIPIGGPFKAGLFVAYPLGMAEGFGVYWLLGWWLPRKSNVC